MRSLKERSQLPPKTGSNEQEWREPGQERFKNRRSVYDRFPSVAPRAQASAARICSKEG